LEKGEDAWLANMGWIRGKIVFGGHSGQASLTPTVVFLGVYWAAAKEKVTFLAVVMGFR
jgi:hypothetical protein